MSVSSAFLKEAYSHHVFAEGILAKQGRSFPSWKKRYFVLTLGKLLYHKTFAGNDSKRRVLKGSMDISKGKVKLLGIWKDSNNNGNEENKNNKKRLEDINGESNNSSSDDENQHNNKEYDDDDLQTTERLSDQDSDNTMTSQEYIVVDDAKSESSKLTMMITNSSESSNNNENNVGNTNQQILKKVPKLERVSKHWRGFAGYEQYKYKICIETQKRVLNLAARSISECKMWLVAFGDATNVENYLSACDSFGVSPIWKICKSLSCSQSKQETFGCSISKNELMQQNACLDITLEKENCVTLSQIRAILSSFGENQEIRGIHFKYCHLSDAYLPEIAEKIAQIETIKELDLSHNNLSGMGLSSLVDGLLINFSLSEINLACNNLKDLGAFHIAEFIMGNPSVTKIDISRNGISSIGAKYLAEALKINDSLEELDISHNNLGDEGANLIFKAILEKKTLKKLNISWNEISNSGSKSISEMCCSSSMSLTELDLKGNEIGKAATENFAKLILTHSGLKSIHFGDNGGCFSEGMLKMGEILKANISIPSLVIQRHKTENP